MKIVTTATHATSRRETGETLAHGVRDALGPRPIDLAVLFVSAHFEDEVERIAFEVHQHLGPRAMIGVTGEAVIAGAEEFEGRPAAVLWAAHMPGARFQTFHLTEDELRGFEHAQELREKIGVPADEMPAFILLADPWSVDINRLIDTFQAAYPARPAIGGLASAGEERGQNRIIFEGQSLREGVCGAALWGNVRIETVVSQGARPIGAHSIITSAERNVIRTLGGRPTLAVVAEVLEKCSERERALARARGLLVGRVINEHQSSFQRGDFLIRAALGFDESTGAMAINDLVRTGQTVQFHVRDAAAARDDLDALLATANCRNAAGVLLFTCNGRGTRLFDEPHHDARVITEACGRQPLAGFFCAGEIGPVAGRNYIHGHTASAGFFLPAEQVP